MHAKLSRRQFLMASSAAASLLVGSGCQGLTGGRTGRTGQADRTPTSARFFFTSQGKTALMNADGTGLRYFEFKQPNQATWQPGPIFPDGRRVIFLSMEPRRDGPGRPFEEYYTQTPTHLWLYDLEKDSLTEIATRQRLAVFYTPALLLGEDRLLVQVVRDKVGQIFSMNLDGSSPREFTRAGEGLPYGLSLSPDGRRVAFHLASPRGYEVWTSDPEGAQRVRIAGRAEHLYFGTSWSPDGQFILYQDCLFKQDPAHDWSDLCIGRADGSEHRVLTSGQIQWFGATYGNSQTHGGGSNMPMWTRAGQILFSRRLSGSKVPWEFQGNRPDTDHFNRDFKPELARGGTEICRFDPRTGALARLTQSNPAVWDFRASESPDGQHIVFCRASTGGMPAIWVMNPDGTNQRMLTQGLKNQGADHPRWLGGSA
ncbi:MAG TPA: serine/threonine protein kinase [Verrucomicrobiae bacterium]|nr:serine/threonine protein kinase [Verrucomicrobiae bacterium]